MYSISLFTAYIESLKEWANIPDRTPFPQMFALCDVHDMLKNIERNVRSTETMFRVVENTR